MDLKQFFLQQIKVGMVLVLFTPLLVGPIGISFSEYPKVLFFRVLIEVILIIYLLLLLRDRRYLPKNSLLLWTIIGFIGALFISGVFGFNFERSFFGDFERSMGIVFYLHLLAFFLILSGIFKTKKDWLFLFRWSVGVSAITTLVVIFQKLDIFFFYSLFHGASSTLSNPSLFGSYLVILVFLTLALIFKEEQWRWRAIWIAILFGNLISLFLSGSRGAWLGVGVGLAAFLFILGITHLKSINIIKKKFVLISFVLALLIAALALSLATSSSLVKEKDFFLHRIFTISDSLETRAVIWGVGLSAFKERPFLGWGLESFSYVFDTHYTYTTTDGAFSSRISFDRAHNKLVGVLVSSGVVGITFYLFIFATILYYLFKKDNPLDLLVRLSLIGLFVAYFTQSLFIFDSVSSAILLFFLFAFMSVTSNDQILNTVKRKFTSISPFTPEFFKKITPLIVALAIAFIIATLYFLNFNPLQKNLLLVKATSFEPEEMGTALMYYQRVIDQDSLYSDDFEIAISERLLKYFEEDWAKPAQFQSIVLLSQIEKTLERKIRVPDKMNRNYFVLLSGIKEKQYFLFENPEKLKELQEVLILSLEKYPNHPEFYRMLGQAYILNGDYELGEEYFQQWFDLSTRRFPELKSIRYYKTLGGAYFKVGEREIAVENFKKAIEIEYKWGKESKEEANRYLTHGTALFTNDVARFYFIELNDVNTAIQIYENAIEVYSEKEREGLKAGLDNVLDSCCR